jgi:hypothetical protein
MMCKRKPTSSEQGIAVKHGCSIPSSNNAVLDALVCALRVSLQAVICGLIFNRQRTTMTLKNKTTSNRLMTHLPVTLMWMVY